MRGYRGVLATALAASLAACGSGLESNLPEIPEVAEEDFPEAARDLAGRRIRALVQSPGDPWANGDLAAILHAHEQLEAAGVLYERAQILSGRGVSLGLPVGSGSPGRRTERRGCRCVQASA